MLGSTYGETWASRCVRQKPGSRDHRQRIALTDAERPTEFGYDPLFVIVFSETQSGCEQQRHAVLHPMVIGVGGRCCSSRQPQCRSAVRRALCGMVSLWGVDESHDTGAQPCDINEL